MGMRATLLACGACDADRRRRPGAGNGRDRHVAERHWSFDGLFGTFDRGALQRGFQVYNDVCSTCHSMRQLYYRNLMEIGFTEDQVKNIAAAKEVDDGPNDEGKMFTRPGRPSDRFKLALPEREGGGLRQ